MLRSSTYKGPKANKFVDSIEDNYCIIWITMVFKDSIPNYVKKNLKKGWQVKHEKLYDYYDGDHVNEIMKTIDKVESKGGKCFSCICEFTFDWTEDPKKHIEKQIAGMNILGWLWKNPKHKNLIDAYAWNKID